MFESLRLMMAETSFPQVCFQSLLQVQISRVAAWQGLWIRSWAWVPKQLGVAVDELLFFAVFIVRFQ
jgi:hypothetical protein